MNSLASLLAFVVGAKKAVVTALGFLVTVLTAYHQLPFLPAQPTVYAVLGVVTAFLTWLVPNKS